MKMLIFGFTGAGKTSFLSSLKKSHENSLLVDLDDHIFDPYKESHSSLSELIEDKGEVWFRAIEKESLIGLININSNIIIALGGGTLDLEFLKRLELLKKTEGLNIKGHFIDESFETCWSRIEKDPNRIIVKKGKEYCIKLYQERRKIFLSAKEALE